MERVLVQLADDGGGWYMHRRQRSETTDRARWQAAALLCVVAADGVLVYALGGPAWLMLLYGALAVMIAAGRVWVARRSRTPAPPPAAPVPSVPVEAPVAGRRALGYVCVPQPVDGTLEEPTRAIAACCEERGLALQRIVHDAVDADGDHARPALAWALERIAKGEAAVLVVPRLRDVSSNVANLPPLLRWFNDPNRTLIAIDMGIDTSTEAGQVAAGALAGVGGWEHQRLSERTRQGLEVARSRGGTNGRAAVADVPELQDRIAAMREQGMTLQAIADQLNAEGVPTLRGGAMWRPSSVQRATGYRRPSANNRGIELPRSGPPKR
jgi:DNA invertase Pin-like site-specific DNA recombinase